MVNGIFGAHASRPDIREPMPMGRVGAARSPVVIAIAERLAVTAMKACSRSNLRRSFNRPAVMMMSFSRDRVMRHVSARRLLATTSPWYGDRQEEA